MLMLLYETCCTVSCLTVGMLCMVILLRCDGRLVVVVETVVLMAGFVLPAEAK